MSVRLIRGTNKKNLGNAQYGVYTPERYGALADAMDISQMGRAGNSTDTVKEFSYVCMYVCQSTRHTND